MSARAQLRRKYQALLDYGRSHPENLEDSLEKLRTLVLFEGIPDETPEVRLLSSASPITRFSHQDFKLLKEGKPTLRGEIWKVLLRVRDLDVCRYVELVNRGPSSRYFIQ